MSGLEGNWTYHVLNLSNATEFPRAGNVTVRAIYAEDVYGQINSTSPAHYFIIWGTANVSNLVSESAILNGTNATFYCNVTDSESSAGIPMLISLLYSSHIFCIVFS